VRVLLPEGEKETLIVQKPQEKALSLYPSLKELMEISGDPLETAVKLAVEGQVSYYSQGPWYQTGTYDHQIHPPQRFKPQFSGLTPETAHPACHLTRISAQNLTKVAISVRNL